MSADTTKLLHTCDVEELRRSRRDPRGSAVQGIRGDPRSRRALPEHQSERVCLEPVPAGERDQLVRHRVTAQPRLLLATCPAVAYWSASPTTSVSRAATIALPASSMRDVRRHRAAPQHEPLGGGRAELQPPARRRRAPARSRARAAGTPRDRRPRARRRTPRPGSARSPRSRPRGPRASSTSRPRASRGRGGRGRPSSRSATAPPARRSRVRRRAGANVARKRSASWP
jgi:hypothetical protein